MGNGSSSSSCAPTILTSSTTTKVLLQDGTLQLYTKTTKSAGELMLENPNHFVCDSKTLMVDQRIQGLSADEVLKPRQLYYLLPMDLYYSVLTHEELVFLTNKATKALQHNKNSHFGKIFPGFSEFCLFPTSKHENETSAVMDSSSNEETEIVQRYSKQRSWKPALDTIVETPSRN